MPLFNVNVRWQKERFKDVQCNTDDDFNVFKAVLFSLTGVPPGRQKMMLSGKIICENNFGDASFKNGVTIMLIGTAEDLPVPQPVNVPTYEQILPDDSTPKLPYGLRNLGNTCYLNAVLQLLYAVPEIRTAIKIPFPPELSPRTIPFYDLVVSLQLLFATMEKTTHPVVPAAFVSSLRRTFPQFATRISSEEPDNLPFAPGSLMEMIRARYAQQDAYECWVKMMQVLQRLQIDPTKNHSLPDLLMDSDTTSVWNPVDRYFTGRRTCKLAATEGDEEPSETDESFTHLSCFINQDVKFLHTGLRSDFEGTVTKHSSALGRDVVYKKTSVLTRLPAYLCVHFMRYFYKEDKQLNAKILKDVKFPLELDVFSFCSGALQNELMPMREKMRLYDDRAVLASQCNKNITSKVEFPNAVDNPELFESRSLARDPGSNNSGYYELMGVLSHQGRTSTSGHYVAWVKVHGNWIKFDDDVTTCVTPEDILQLSGGADRHCAYLLLYSSKRLLKDERLDLSSTGASAVVGADSSTKVEPTPLSGDRQVDRS